MSILFKCLLVILGLTVAAADNFKELHVGVAKDPGSFIGTVDVDKLLQPFLNKSTKTLFKAWHFIFNKEYDYNSEVGIRKYKVFKSNIKLVNDHNAKNLSWQMGINHLSDMTDGEIEDYYHLKPINENLLTRSLRENGEPEFWGGQEKLTGYPQTNWGDKMRPVRNQGSCGSCWAFTTQAVLEGCFALWQEKLSDWFSTQESVDCDTGNGGCNGGWYTNAFKFFQTKSLVYEAGYPYTAKKGTCRYSDTMSGNTKIKVTGFNYYYKGQGSIETYYGMLKRGPVAVAVDANSDWFRYKSGIFDSKSCKSGINHAVTLIGYKSEGGKCDNKSGSYYIIRNSWGSNWGDAGHMKIKDNGTASSCNVEKYAFQVKAFTK